MPGTQAGDAQNHVVLHNEGKDLGVASFAFGYVNLSKATASGSSLFESPQF